MAVSSGGGELRGEGPVFRGPFALSGRVSGAKGRGSDDRGYSRDRGLTTPTFTASGPRGPTGRCD